MKRRVGAWTAGIAALFLAGLVLWDALAKPKAERYTYTVWDCFNTVGTVTGYAASPEEWDRQMEALHADLLACHKLFDTYHEYEGLVNLASVNRAAGRGPVAVDERIVSMLALAKEEYAATGGKLNVAGGAVLALWHETREEGKASPATARLPEEAALDKAAEHIQINDLVLDEAAGTVELRDAAMKLDVGSVGKGWAVEWCARRAEERGLERAVLDIGGNVRTIGLKPGEKPWTTALVSPWDKGGGPELPMLALPAGVSCVTSGDYQNYYTVDGVRYSHLIDLSTKLPATFARAVTVICADSGLADCLSTGLFCLPPEEGRALVESLSGVEALWVLPDGSLEESGGFAAYKAG